MAIPTPPKRIDGPTPNGGAYSIAYTHDDGGFEVVEFDSDDQAIHRTYSAPVRPRSD